GERDAPQRYVIPGQVLPGAARHGDGLVLVPEAVPVPQARELVDQGGPDQRAGAAAGDVVLGQAADPQVDVVHVAVEVVELLLEAGVGGDLREAVHLRQAVRLADAVVVG